MNKENGIFHFLVDVGWNDAELTPLKADFSTRKFARLKKNKGNLHYAILMQAAPDQKTKEFIVIAELLRKSGLSVPKIYAVDIEGGFVLMEDLGDTTFGALLDSGQKPLPLYRRAIDALVHLHKTFDLGWTEEVNLPSFNSQAFTAQAELFLDSYFPYTLKRSATSEERDNFCAAWMEILKPFDNLPQTLMLRDFMPDNLMDLPERDGFRSVGILDFQDGGLGPIAYDIASLCESVRRNVPLSLLDEIVEYYHLQNPIIPFADLLQFCRIISAQRHMRVLGILAKLATSGRNEKLIYVPRILKYLRELLRNNALSPIKAWSDSFVTYD